MTLLQPTTLEVIKQETSIVEVISSGPQGPNSIGGHGFSINSLAVGDLLVFGGSAWENSNKTVLTDGGNF